MSFTEPASASDRGEYLDLRSEGREPGARRKKLAGYWKAANEIRQAYFGSENRNVHEHNEDGPSQFHQDAAIVSNGTQELILFPSYAAAHVKTKTDAVSTPGKTLTEEEYWRREWHRHEESNAVVNVNVRGWLYAPQKGQTTRKQRLLIGLARQLSGLPASSANHQDSASNVTPSQSRNSSPIRSQDDELIAKEAENIMRKGQREERFARRGEFSEQPTSAEDSESIYDVANDRGRHRGSYASSVSAYDADGPVAPLQGRASWPALSNMTSAELAVANTHLVNRLKPFMANPLPNSPISAFFYNDSSSRQQTVSTDAAGHFSFHAPLDFVPTHVRVLAGDKLSATEEVTVTPPRGVSLISDIDDTIKHTAITSGAREIFRNAFVRELGDLTIDGVREWYTTLHDMGVQIHYVSNAPWQMYPVLTSFFKLAKLPKGSFHLKMYAGMLQGIFEPVAERKKSSLDKIMRDFPHRKFVLVGDSGEADLEVYTDVTLENPGRILGIFIRDVTTPERGGYFDSNRSPGGSRSNSRSNSRQRSTESLALSKKLSRPEEIRNDDPDVRAAIAASLQDKERAAGQSRKMVNRDAVATDDTSASSQSIKPPAPPPRRLKPLTSVTSAPMTSSPEEDLIDFTDPAPKKLLPALPVREGGAQAQVRNSASPGQKPAPSLPPKPAGLRSPPSNAKQWAAAEASSKPPPPKPPKPSTLAKRLQTVPPLQLHQPSPLSTVTRQASMTEEPPPLPARPKTLMGRFAQAMPTVSSGWHGDSAPSQARARSTFGRSQPNSPLAGPMTASDSFDAISLPDPAVPESATAAPRPPLPARRNLSSLSLRTASPRRSGGPGDDDGGAASPGGEGMGKKEYLWRQRWAHAKDLLERRGVLLRTWRVGSDIADECVRLVETAQREVDQ